MVVTFADGRKFKFTFCHSSHNFVTPPDAGQLRTVVEAQARDLNRRISYTEISRIDDVDTIVGVGMAITHPNDTFNRNKGRKFATDKAIKAAGFTYDERVALWTAYFSEFKPV